MKARIATYGDVAQLVRVCRQQHDRSSWKELQFNPVLVKKNLIRLIRMDGADALVSVDDAGKIHGVLLATLDQFFMNKALYATDIHFMCDKGGVQLFREFKRWAQEHNASKILMGIGNDDPEGKIHAFYEAMGMRPVGDAWVLDLQTAQEVAA